MTIVVVLFRRAGGQGPVLPPEVRRRRELLDADRGEGRPRDLQPSYEELTRLAETRLTQASCSSSQHASNHLDTALTMLNNNTWDILPTQLFLASVGVPQKVKSLLGLRYAEYDSFMSPSRGLDTGGGGPGG